MKKYIISFLAAVISFSLAAQTVSGFDVTRDEVRQAMDIALSKASVSLKNASFSKKGVMVIQMPGDPSGVMAGRLKNLLINSGIECLEGKNDPMWKEIIKEIAWTERKDDILDATTIVKFGKLKGAQVLFYGTIRSVSATPERVFVEIELNATDIATRKIVWGGNFSHRLYVGKEIGGQIKLDRHIHTLLEKNFAKALTSLQSQSYASIMKHIKQVSVLPLSGDINGYMTNLAIGLLTKTPYKPEYSPISSLTQFRMAVRDKVIKSDAVLYGSVRDIRREKVETEETKDKKIKTTFDVYADIQLFIEDVKTGAILWSEPIRLTEQVFEYKNMTNEEIAKYRKEKLDALPDAVIEDAIDNWKKYLLAAGIVVAAVILLLLLILGIKMIISYNDVR